MMTTTRSMRRSTAARDSYHAPPIARCRYAVLRLSVEDWSGAPAAAFVVYDRRESRIVDGVYRTRFDALMVAEECNATGEGRREPPTCLSLELTYPVILAHFTAMREETNP